MVEILVIVIVSAVVAALAAVWYREEHKKTVHNSNVELKVGVQFEGSLITRTAGVDHQVSLWNPEWKVKSLQSGRLTTDIKKGCGGIIIAFSNQYGTVHGSDSCSKADGVAFVIDNPHPRHSTYVADLPWMNAPSNASEVLVNANGSQWLRSDEYSHVVIEWFNGQLVCTIDGRTVVRAADRLPGTYIGFGSYGGSLGNRGPPGIQHLGFVRNTQID